MLRLDAWNSRGNRRKEEVSLGKFLWRCLCTFLICSVHLTQSAGRLLLGPVWWSLTSPIIIFRARNFSSPSSPPILAFVVSSSLCISYSSFLSAYLSPLGPFLTSFLNIFPSITIQLFSSPPILVCTFFLPLPYSTFFTLSFLSQLSDVIFHHSS